MFLRYYELKELIYAGQTVLGIILVLVSFYQLYLSASASAPLLNLLTALILAVVGGGCIFFGIETYLLRDDPDIWR